ncbi:unnamed protein product [Paramecium octaurelia]|uniref:WD-40 repeat protein n=1 Tax=Paramecium octaurelia TaxID=43137 RepID=A0A8S1Y8B4_PAROT|nr:unnamed protein product [Paramecium octaurelia]
MNCTHHFQYRVSSICVAPHLCQYQRKLCVECQYEHAVDKKQEIPIFRFQEMAIKKLKEYELDQTFELIEYKKNYQILLDQMKKNLEEILESIFSIYDMIEQQNQQYKNLINENTNLLESSQTDLEKLIEIFQGKIINDWIGDRNYYFGNLDQAMIVFNQEITKGIEKLNQRIKEIYPFFKQEFKQSSEIHPTEQSEYVYEWKQDLYEIFSSIKHIDSSLLARIIEILREEQISDYQILLQKQYLEKLQESQIYNNQLKEEKNTIKFIIAVVKNVLELDFNEKNFSTDEYKEIRADIIQKIQKQEKIILFLKFLVHLTAIDNKTIQCGSNSLNLLVLMKVDLSEQCFQKIKIKNTSLIGANFFKCNLSESEFDNVDISGMNLNGAQLVNCKWKNIKIFEQNKFEDPIYSISFSPNSLTIASGGDDNYICLWDIKTGQQKSKLIGHTSWVRSVCFSPDGNILASGGDDQSILLWEVRTEQQQFKLIGHTSCVYSVCFSPNGAILASGSHDKTIRLWDVKTGQLKKKFNGLTSVIYSVCFSPDGATLAFGSDEFIRLYDLKAGQQKSILYGHEHAVKSVCFSPDGSTLTSGSNDNTIRLWDIKTGQQKFILNGHTKAVYSVCFSPDGTTLASGSDDNSIRLWDVRAGKQKSKLDGHKKEVLQVCFYDDSTIASCSGDSSICLWDVMTDQQASRFNSHSLSISQVCFSQDGATSAFSSFDQSFCSFDRKSGQQFKPLDTSYQDILSQFSTQLYTKCIYFNFPKLVLSNMPFISAQGALIFDGELFTSFGTDLRKLFQERGSCVLKSLEKIIQK